MTDLADYIRQAAIARGIDPVVALRVAQGEGGLKNPFRRGEGPAPKSQDPRFGGLENSFGPFQLYVSGRNAGLGDRAVAAGIDPSKNWQGGIDFALDEAKRVGWGQWYGAKAAGITGMMGIGGRPAGAPQQAARPSVAGIPAATEAGMPVSAPPQSFGDLVAPPAAAAPPSLAQIAANYIARKRGQEEAEAADQARRQALFGGGIGDLYG